ncbi:hypothetical protein C2E31_06090 [Rhodopirellula baltica]|nr:hypothetical protein C2E31_06090 [Rhodopirellula baltica]
MRNLKLRRRQGFSSSQLSAVSTVVSPLAGGVIAGLVVVVMLSPIAISQEPAQNTSGLTDTARTLGAGTKSNEEIIRDLIEKLGSDSYATRVRARDQLKSFGLEAFDALREAQKHNDSEVQTAARYLHKSLQVRWSNESDPKQVQEILFEYGAQSTTDRLARIELLGRLPDFMGGEAWHDWRDLIRLTHSQDVLRCSF